MMFDRNTAKNSILMTDAGITYVVQNNLTGTLDVCTFNMLPPPSLAPTTADALVRSLASPPKPQTRSRGFTSARPFSPG